MARGGSRTKGMKLNYPESRRSPILHVVTAYTRQGMPVNSFERGLGRKSGVLKIRDRDTSRDRDTRLEIEKKWDFTVEMPQICYFCGEEIMKKRGKESKSLCFHSLDGDHDNWDPENKVSAHGGCHISFHNGGKKGTIAAKKRWVIRRDRHGPSGLKDPETFGRAVSERMSGEDGGAKKAWATRRVRYPPNGMKPKEAS